jgi:CheY-like chemotaxis protein
MLGSPSRIREFLINQTCLVVEPSNAFASAVKMCLTTLEESVRVVFTRNYADAVIKIETLKPRLLVTEYHIDGNFGLGLIEQHRMVIGDEQRVSILITRNADDSVIAEAAEEQVDAYLLKPFSTEEFQARLEAVIEGRAAPTVFKKKIYEGKKLLEAKDYPAAIRLFYEAKKENSLPSLACYYSGESFRRIDDRTRALAEFVEGLHYQPVHYNCLIGKFEVLMDEKWYTKAYDVVPILLRNFPLTAKRLTQIFVTTVFAKRFDDLPVLYEKFLMLENRTRELIKIVSMGMYTAGKWYLAQGQLEVAVEFFDKAATTAGRDFSMLEMIVNELIKTPQCEEHARAFLGKVLLEDINQPHHSQLVFRVDQLTLTKNELMERGRKLIMSGQGSPEIFESVVRLMAEKGKVTLAETMIGKALETHPDLKDRLYEVLETTPRITNPDDSTDPSDSTPE